jgi:hypothetical protein
MQVAKTNPFSDYVSRVPLDTPSCEIKSVIIHNLETISQCAISEYFVDESQLASVVLPALNTKTLRFVPPPQPSWFLPQAVSSRFGMDSSMVVDSAENIKYFFDFLTSNAADLASLEICVEEQKSTFANYFLRKYKTLKYGLTYLESAYQQCQRKADSEYIQTTKKVLVCAISCYAIIGNYNLYEVTGFFAGPDSALEILDFERYAPLKKILQIQNHIWKRDPKIKRMLKDEHLQFFAGCLRMKQPELTNVCTTIEKILINNEPNVSKRDLFYAVLLKEEKFAKLHAFCTAKLLRTKKLGGETQEQFETRAGRAEVKQVLDLVKSEISEIKSQEDSDPNRERNLTSFLNSSSFGDNLVYYKPFQAIFNFIFHHYDTPKIEGYCKLPFKMIGNYKIKRFVAKVLLAVSDINQVDFSSKSGRRILVQCSEFFFLEPANIIDPEAIREWARAFPEAFEFPAIKQAITPLLQS